MVRLIAIGERGTAFADLSDRQLSEVKVNGENPVFEKERRTKEQKEKRDKGEHTGMLWSDSRSYLSTKDGQGYFWLGTVEEALLRSLVWRAKIKVDDSTGTDEFIGYLRTDYHGQLPHGKKHKFIAVETLLGRVEAYKVRREVGNGNRNDLFVRKVVSIIRLQEEKREN